MLSICYQLVTALGTLLVRGIDDELINRLKGRSAEAMHRDNLCRALTKASPEMPFSDLRGKIHISPDFDRTPHDIIDAMEAAMCEAFTGRSFLTVDSGGPRTFEGRDQAFAG